MMDVAIEEAKEGVERGEGGPFGAVIVDANGKVPTSQLYLLRIHSLPLSTISSYHFTYFASFCELSRWLCVISRC